MFYWMPITMRCPPPVFRESIHRLRSVDDAFRQQLDVKEENHRREIAEITRKNQHEVDTANKHVSNIHIQ